MGSCFSAGTSTNRDDSGVFLGCCWGFLAAFHNAIGDDFAAFDAYTSEIAGLFWGALAVLKFRFAGEVRFRCDCLSAVQGAAGRFPSAKVTSHRL